MKQLLLYLATFLFTLPLSAQVVINEMSPDAANFDGNPPGQTGEFIELYNTGTSTVDISGWMLVDDDAAIRIPENTTLAADEHYLMGSYGLDASPSGSIGPGISCVDCDFAGITLDGNWGPNTPTLQLVGSHVIGTYCNGGNKDEAWILLDATKNIVDAVYYGTDVNSCGYTSQIHTIPAYGTLPATTVESAVAPHDGTTPTVVSNSNITNTNNVSWSYAGPQINGCNSSYIRIPDGGSWVNGVIDNGTLASLGTYNTGAQPTTQPSNHPTPGNYNDSIPFIFDVSTSGSLVAPVSSPQDVAHYVLCTSDPVTFSYTVYNFQNVQNDANYATNKIGSYVEATGAGAVSPSAWNSITPDGSGTTTLTHTLTPPVGSTEYTLVWADFIINCCGSSSYNVTSGNTTSSTAWECYERRKVKITVVDPMVSLHATNNISCPGDFSPGTVNIASLVSGGFDNQYELFDNGVSVSSNNTGVFNLGNALVGPITVTVTDGSGCSADINFNIDISCKTPPVCPMISADLTNSSSSGTFCPQDTLAFVLDLPNSTGLPNGGVINWYQGTTNSFDPYTSPTSDLIDTAHIIQSGGTAYAGAPRINEFMSDTDLFDGSGSNSSGEWIEIACNAGDNIGCHLLTDGDWVVQIPPNTACPVSGFYTIGTSNANYGDPSTFFTPSLDISTCSGCIVGGSGALVLTNGGEFISLFDPSGTQIDNITYGNPTGTNAPGNSESLASLAGCTSLSSITTSLGTSIAADPDEGYSMARDTDGTGNWIQSDATPNATNEIASTTIRAVKMPLTTNMCNTGDFYIRGIVTPIDPSCSTSDATTVALGPFNILCPTISLNGMDTICNGLGTPVSANLTLTANSSVDGYTPYISVNGVTTAYAPLIGAGPTYSIAVTDEGSYEIDSLVPPTGDCMAQVTSPNFAEIFPYNPPLVIIQGDCVGANLDEPTVSITPQEAVNNPSYTITTPTGVSPSTNNTGVFTLPSAYIGPILAEMNHNGCVTQVSDVIGPCPNIPPIATALHIVDFSAHKQENAVLLKWTVEGDENLTKYQLQRGTVPARMEDIYTQEIDHEESMLASHKYLDLLAEAGTNYYRLKLVSDDEDFFYSSILAVNNENQLTDKIKLFPNPSRGRLTLEIQSQYADNIVAKILDITGRLISKQELSVDPGIQTSFIRTDGLTQGIYTLHIQGITMNEHLKFMVE